MQLLAIKLQMGGGVYRIAGNFVGANFHAFKYFVFYNTAQHSDVEPIVRGSFNFWMMLYSTKCTKISTVRKLPAVRYAKNSTARAL